MDVLVEFEPGRAPGYFGFAGMELELSEMLGRKVDLRTAAELSRYFRDEVVASAAVQYDRMMKLRATPHAGGGAGGHRFRERKTGDDLTRDRMLLLSLVKEIEIIGEAARHVSPETKAGITGIPWLDVTGMRNQLTHGYFDWDIERIWETVSSDLPELVRVLESCTATQSVKDLQRFSRMGILISAYSNAWSAWK